MLQMFGRNFEELGQDEGGLILKGKIKIKWGNKFLDLLDKDGLISPEVLSSIIERIETIEEELGIGLDDDEELNNG